MLFSLGQGHFFMPKANLGCPWVLLLLTLSLGFGCAFAVKRPCSQGGQAPHEGVFEGKKRCFQEADTLGQMVNHGEYLEWFPSEKIRWVGEYHYGKKTGRWIQYDEDGKKLTDQYYENGQEVSRP